MQTIDIHRISSHRIACPETALEDNYMIDHLFNIYIYTYDIIATMSYFYMMYIICLIWIININMCIRYTSGPALSESIACETVWLGQTLGLGHELASHHWRLPCETVWLAM